MKSQGYIPRLSVNQLLSGKIAKGLCLLMLAFCLLRAWNYGQANPGLDFYQFWVVGQKISPGEKTDIYSDANRASIGSEFLGKANAGRSLRYQWVAQHRQILETYSTPFLYSVFKAFSFGDYDIAYSFYQAFCIVCMVFAFVTLSRLLRFSFFFSMLLLSFILVFFAPYRSEVRVANVNQIQLALLALFLWFQNRVHWKSRHFLGGIVLGVMLMFKPNILFVIGLLSLSWLLDGQFKKAAQEYAGFVFAALCSFFFSCWMFGSLHCWADWFSAVESMPPSITPVTLGNYSLSRLVIDRSGVDPAKYLTFALMGVTLFFLWRSRRRVEGGRKLEQDDFLRDALLVGIGCLVYLLSATLVWLHYFLLSIPVALFLLRPREGSQTSGRRVTVRWILSVFAFLLISIDPLTVFFTFKTPEYLAMTLITGAFLLFAMAMDSLRASDHGKAPANNL